MNPTNPSSMNPMGPNPMTPLITSPNELAIRQRTQQIMNGVLPSAASQGSPLGSAGTRDNYTLQNGSPAPQLDPTRKTASAQAYSKFLGELKPRAILPISNRIVDEATDTEEVPDYVASALFNSTRMRIHDTATYVARARLAIENAERYYRGLTGAASGANNLSSLFSGVPETNRQSEAPQPTPHHHHMTLREGAVIQGLFARIPAAKAGPLDRDNESQVESSEAADRVLQSLLGGLDASETQIELIRKLFTGGNVFGIVDDCGEGYDDPEWQVPVWTFAPYTQLIQPAVFQCDNQGCPASAGMPVPELSKDANGAPYSTEQPPPPAPGSPAAPPPEEIPSSSSPGTCPLCASPGTIHTPILLRYQIARQVKSVWSPGLEISMEDALTVTVPVLENFDYATWFARTRYWPIGKVLARFQQMRKNWRAYSGGGSDLSPSYNYWYSNYAAEVRSMITPDTISMTLAMNNNWQVDELWLSACDFHCLETDPDGLAGQWMAQRFPRGAKLTFVQRRLVEIRHADIHRQIFMFRSDAGSGTYANPMANPVIAANRVADMAIGLMLRSIRNGIPTTFYRQSVLTPETIRRMAHGHVDHVPVGSNVANMKDVIYQTSPPAPPQGISNAVEYADQSIRPVMGTTDPIVGEASSSVETTLGGDQLRLNRALTRHHPLWVLIRKGWAFLDTALLRLATDRVGEIPNTAAAAPGMSPGMDPGMDPGVDPGTDPNQPAQSPQPPAPLQINQIIVGGHSNGMPGKLEISLEEKAKILEGGWKIEIEETLPLTSSQIQAAISSLLESQSPIIQNMFNDPRNVGVLQKYLLPPGFYQPQQDAIEQVRRFIKWLRQDGAPPMENGEDAIDPILSQALGRSVYRASRPISASDMDPLLCYEVVMQWCKSPAGRAARGSGLEPRPEYRNVLYWGQHNKALADYQQMQMQMQAQMQAQAQAGPGGEGSASGAGGEEPAPGQDPAQADATVPATSGDPSAPGAF